MSENIGAAGNTLVPAVLTLESMGYRIGWERHDDQREDWHADGPLGHFWGDDPLELLGLITMRELRGVNWKATDEQIDAFAARYLPDPK
ncbi:MAG TPA: hypothetical protein VHV55_12610 [Pirellulales bacterium]|jgi:hypothetical protein|nr:hypothetical protein [Pirellulales bacterium]